MLPGLYFYFISLCGLCAILQPTRVSVGTVQLWEMIEATCGKNTLQDIFSNFDISKSHTFINKPVCSIKNKYMSHLCGVCMWTLHAIPEVLSQQPPSLARLIIPQITNPLISRKSHPCMPAPHYFINMSFLINTSLSLFALYTLESRHLAKKTDGKKKKNVFNRP